MEALQNEQRETCYTQVDYVATKMVTRKTFWTGMFACSLLSVCWGGAWVYYLGPSIGVVGVEGESYARLVEINARLNEENQREAEENARLNEENQREAEENARLNEENERLFFKNQEHAETKEAVLGLIFNAPGRLEAATRANTLRPNGFPFAEWNPGLTSKAIRAAISLENYKSLEWVIQQKNWNWPLSDKTANAVRAAVASRNDMVAEAAGQ